MLFTRFPPHHHGIYVRTPHVRRLSVWLAFVRFVCVFVCVFVRTRAARVPPCDSPFHRTASQSAACALVNKRTSEHRDLVYSRCGWKARTVRHCVFVCAGCGGESSERVAVSLLWRYGYACRACKCKQQQHSSGTVAGECVANAGSFGSGGRNTNTIDSPFELLALCVNQDYPQV